MRLATLVLIGLVLAVAIPAQAALCPDCRKASGYTKDIGDCTECKDGKTGSGQFKLCFRCSDRLQQCMHCLKPLPAPATRPATRPIDSDKDDHYTEGAWEYRFTVTLRGTRSQGCTGELFYQGKPVAEPETINDFYQTPWGAMYWVGKPAVLFGGHGWMTKPKVSAKPGKQLPAPASAKGEAAGPRLLMRVVVADRQPVPDLAPLEGWIEQELKKLDLPHGVAWSDWQELKDEFYVVHDSRHYGQLHVRLGTTKNPETLAADFGGESQVELPRREGARRLVHVPLQSSIARLDLYLAFKVECR